MKQKMLTSSQRQDKRGKPRQTSSQPMKQNLQTGAQCLPKKRSLRHGIPKQHKGERPGNSELLRKDANHGKLLNPWLLFFLRTVGFENRSPLSIRRRKTKQKNFAWASSFQIQQILCFTLKRTYLPVTMATILPPVAHIHGGSVSCTIVF